jgi:phosphate transport system permease protein
VTVVTDLVERETTRSGALPLHAPRLPKAAPLLVGAMAVGVAGLTGVLLGWSPVAMVLVGWVVHVIALTTWAGALEGRRKAVDRMASVLIWSTFLVAVVPLVAVTWQVVSKGHGIISAEFFTSDNGGLALLGHGGGIEHALVGTLVITLTATAISVPIGVMAAIYLIEYGRGRRLARTITFLVDVMTGIPSIVAGLFAFALLTLVFDPSYRAGLGGAIALSVLMVPVVVRATEEMLKLVPDELREASYALGVPKWRTIVKVVLPTALGGIATGVTLAIARVAGETAPLLIIAGAANTTNWNVFDGRMMTLPVYIFSNATQGNAKYAELFEARAWGAALVLVAIVMLLNLVARLVGRIFSPPTGR